MSAYLGSNKFYPKTYNVAYNDQRKQFDEAEPEGLKQCRVCSDRPEMLQPCVVASEKQRRDQGNDHNGHCTFQVD